MINTTAASAAAASTTTSTTTKSASSSSSSMIRKEAKHTSADVTRRMVCGGLAGMIAKTATNPLERIKMLSQTGEHNSSSSSNGSSSSSAKSPHRPPGMVALYRDILRHEGVLGLWAGNGVNLLRVFPAKAIVFSSNDVYKAFLVNLFMPDAASASSSSSINNSNKSLSGPLSFLAGGMAGMTACFFTYPLDLARGRISGKLAGPAAAAAAAAAPISASSSGGGAAAAVTLTSATATKSTKIYNGITQTIVLTVKDEGFMALFKGVTPTLLGAMPYEGIKFGTVGLLECYFPKDDGGFLHHPHYPWRKMVFGGVGGVMAGLITYPNDTVRRMLQLQGSRSRVASSSAAAAVPTFTGYWDCVRYIYRHYGIARFYSGCAINIIRMAPNTAIQFGSYEILKKWTDDMFD